MVHTANPDLQTRFDLATSADRAALSRWVERSLSATYPHLVTSPTRPARATEDRATIGLTGLWESASGRGEDVRCSAKALDAVGFTDYRIIDLQSGKIFYPDGQVAPHGALRVDVNIVHHNADTAVEDWIALRRRGVSADRTIGFWAWELEHLPQSWLHAYSFFDEIWAASRFAFRAFYQPRLRPVRLVPMAVVPTTPKQQKRAQLAVPDDHTMFLFTFDYRSYVERKNPLAVIDAFARAFPTFREKTALVIKTLGADSAPAAHQALAEAVAYDNRIQLMDAVLSRREMMGLVAAADAYVSLHRSEGFGRGPAEAMLVGVPVIVTDYSGTTDFATRHCALPVPYHLISVAERDYPGADGQRWAAPDVDAAAHQMQFVHQNPLTAEAIGKRGRKQVRLLYNPKRVGQRMLSVLKLTGVTIPSAAPILAA
jgi:glycosyltransferase involved in cell wall biosynthesis